MTSSSSGRLWKKEYGPASTWVDRPDEQHAADAGDAGGQREDAASLTVVSRRPSIAHAAGLSRIASSIRPYREPAQRHDTDADHGEDHRQQDHVDAVVEVVDAEDAEPRGRSPSPPSKIGIVWPKIVTDCSPKTNSVAELGDGGGGQRQVEPAQPDGRQRGERADQRRHRERDRR